VTLRGYAPGGLSLHTSKYYLIFLLVGGKIRAVKLSVSVPDDLWQAAAVDEQSPSAVVQEGLRALVAHREKSAQRVGEFELRLSLHADGSELDLAETLKELTDAAVELYDVGYRMGVEIAGKLKFIVLDGLPSGAKLRDLLLDAADDVDTPLAHLVRGALEDWEFGLDVEGDVIPSPTLYDGMAAGLEDMRGAVRGWATDKIRTLGDK
jgi:hypothetical protein